MVLITIILILFALLMLRAAYTDLTRYRLSNRLTLAVALLYPAFLLATHIDGHGMPWPDILLSVVIASALFMVCAGFFALRVMGGGDVKLIPLVALWAGPDHAVAFLFIMSVAGGVIAVVLLVRNRIKASKYMKSSENINLCVAKQRETAVPYGAGIALGGLYTAQQLYAAYGAGLF